MSVLVYTFQDNATTNFFYEGKKPLTLPLAVVHKMVGCFQWGCKAMLLTWILQISIHLHFFG